MPAAMTEISPEAATDGNVTEYTVGEISQAVKRTLEGTFEHVRVRGEIGRPNYHSSGHLYFTLKDEAAAQKPTKEAVSKVVVGVVKADLRVKEEVVALNPVKVAVAKVVVGVVEAVLRVKEEAAVKVVAGVVKVDLPVKVEVTRNPVKQVVVRVEADVGEQEEGLEAVRVEGRISKQSKNECSAGFLM